MENSNRDSKWKLNGARRLWHHCHQELRKLSSLAEGNGTSLLFSERNFLKVHGEMWNLHHQERRVMEEDVSFSFVWHSSPSRMIRWRDFKAMYVSKHLTHSILRPVSSPMAGSHQSLQGVIQNPSFRTCSFRGRDLFFRVLWQGEYSKHSIQHVMLKRISLSMGSEVCNDSKLLGTQFMARYRRYYLHRDLTIADFFDSAPAMIKFFKDCKKRSKFMAETLVLSAGRNEHSWRGFDNETVYVFDEDASVKAEMKHYIDVGDFRTLLGRAQQGVITENFLEWLYSIRQVYQNARLSGTGASGDGASTVLTQHLGWSPSN